MVNLHSTDNVSGLFQNHPEYFQHFKGQLIPASEIKQHAFTEQRVAIIGTNQHTVTALESICQVAQSVYVFQNAPQFILPKTERGIQRLIQHPLVIKNRRLFNTRIKCLLALRFLETQVQDPWLRHQLKPNSAADKLKFFKSDHYYHALQRDNCKLITWPIVKIREHDIQSLDGAEYPVDVIITTYSH